MRIGFTIILACLIAALLRCTAVAKKSEKSIALPVMNLLLALIPPMAGNLILIISTNRILSTVGCYIYFLGMDLVMLTLLRFTGAYCNIQWPKAVRYFFWALLSVDALQILANVFTGHAFGIEEIMAYGSPYFRLIPYVGQTFHRLVDYGILAAVLGIFIAKLIRSPRIDSERYSVILITMIITTIWETLYIFSRTPVDRSMIGFGVFGLMVFYFSLYYHPFRLLDRMLVTAVSEIPDALFFFDVNDNCVWINRRGIELIGIEGQGFESAKERLKDLLHISEDEESEWSGKHITGTGEAIRSYVSEQKIVNDEKGRPIGSFLTVRDNSDEQKTLQREIYNATHDSLTRIYNRAGYELLLSHMELDSILMLLIDGDNFKLINDRYGHEVGDRTLQKIARVIKHSFRGDDHVCRFGGDEFVVLMRQPEPPRQEQIRDRIHIINSLLSDTSDGLPEISVSAGCAHGSKASDRTELFEHADRALYETKRNGRNGITFYPFRAEN